MAERPEIRGASELSAGNEASRHFPRRPEGRSSFERAVLTAHAPLVQAMPIAGALREVSIPCGMTPAAYLGTPH